MVHRLALPLLLLLAVPALAQPAPAPRANPAEARRTELDRLFEALKSAPDAQGGQLVETRIRALWSQSVSPAIDDVVVGVRRHHHRVGHR
ncbi:MAG: hypothetical protein K2X46_04020, partial [Roseomonas sp.]|nr:hypothetical protein [Roseomonas sp.]